ncbi:hypothetical protein ACIQF6_28180 [Kitasatospora sp. NPDC092948]|uniref:hypothetical protein n=1 Tax=Kitasatospora sp. NPDC092948 TaxID=3364088 RepID=UPI0037F20CC9
MTARQEAAVLRHTVDVTPDDLDALAEFMLERIQEEINARGARGAADALEGMVAATRVQARRCLEELGRVNVDPVQRASALVRLDAAWASLCMAVRAWQEHPNFDTARWRRPEGTFPDRLGPMTWVPGRS